MKPEQWRQEMRDFIVKSREKKSKIDDKQIDALLDRLLHSEFLIEPRWAKIAEGLSQEIQAAFPQFSNVAVIPLGSAIHGGAYLRQITQESSPGQVGDFDWGMTMDQEIVFDDPILPKVNALAKALVPKLGQKFGIEKKVESCSRHNGKNFRVKNLSSVNEAIEHIVKTDDNYIPDQDPFFQIFQPSFPAEINQRNQKIFLDGLRQVARKDRQLWKRVVDNMVFAWTRVHRIQGKHLINPESSDKDAVKKSNELAEYSGNVMVRVFEAILLSTGK